jgi:hypothetical protein
MVPSENKPENPGPQSNRVLVFNVTLLADFIHTFATMIFTLVTQIRIKRFFNEL